MGFALAGPALASDEGYIYGRVQTRDGDVYQGQLRWGTEEAFWDDIFNANKFENENLQYVDRKDLRRVRSHHSSGWDLLGFGDSDLTHVFAIRFGDLKRLEVRGGDDVIAEFRNGEEMRLRGGSNDIGARITVVDPKLGKHELKWDRIRTIEFMNTPATLTRKLGDPIYGTVTCGRYDFTGRIQWDNDETLTSDMLDGDTNDGDVSLEFGDIASIRKHRNGALVKLKGGDELYLTGSNDVNHENRGVDVVVPGVGTVKIGWNDFDELKLAPAPGSGSSYADYGRGSDLSGEVETPEGRLSGRIIFDLDESRDFELLQGKSGDTEYLIPFRDIARIKPLGNRRSEVQLRMGLTVDLEESEDVTRKNDGLLVFTGDRKPKYVAWHDVSNLRLEPSPR
jgi:hypothetical protein